jgi:hypothetical protein
VAEDAADLGDVEAEVDDQVAGEGVAQVVEARRGDDPGACRGALERTALDATGRPRPPEARSPSGAGSRS